MIERAPFGATGHDSSRAIFGAAALGKVSKGDADRSLELLLEHGINHIDVAASYGDAELRIATWLRRNPGTFFVATKTGERTYQKAKEQIHRSLERLRVDNVDLIQLHNLAQADEWGVAMGPGGALEAAAKRHNVSAVQLALAWLLHRSPAMLPIPGTSSVAHLEENEASASLKLSPEDWKEIDALAARG
jgi:aryl-alcohol dehydrogenase-like predicted oxidoreductase